MNDATRQALLALAGDDASNPLLFKCRFMELASREGLLAFRPVSLWEPPKRQAILRGLIETEGLPGDVAECGVYMGGGTFLMAETLTAMGSTRRVFAVDSFEGLPEPTDRDAVPSKGNAVHYVKGMFKEANFELLDFLVNVWKHDARVTLIKGFFEDALPRAFPTGRAFSMVVVDPDQYAGAMFCLEFFYPRVPAGGLIFFDDYRGTLAEGVNRAVDEFFADKPESPEQGGLTMWYVRKR